MLRQVDARRKVFRFPGAARCDGGYLGLERTRRPLQRNSSGTGATNHWADECWQSRAKPRWQEGFCPGLADTRRIVALRREITTPCALSLGNFSDGARLLSRWRVGRLQRRLRRHDVAKQSGWNTKASTCFSADAGVPASMVSRRKADHFLRSSTWRAL